MYRLQDIVGGYEYQQAIYLFHGYDKVLGCCGVKLLDMFISLWVFDSISICPCSIVDDGAHIFCLYHLADGFEIADVEFCDIRKNVLILAILSNDFLLVAELAVGSGY